MPAIAYVEFQKNAGKHYAYFTGKLHDCLQLEDWVIVPVGPQSSHKTVQIVGFADDDRFANKEIYALLITQDQADRMAPSTKLLTGGED